MSSANEWDPLKKVIVGISDNAKVPPLDLSMRVVNYAGTAHPESVPVGRYPAQVIAEAASDLDALSCFLQSVGVEVMRPSDTDPAYYNYCPRDSVLVYKDIAVATPMPLQSRRNEWHAFRHHLGAFSNVVDLSQPHPSTLYNAQCINNKEQLALTEVAPAFDAANVLRANDDLFYLVSNSGNQQGARLLQETIGDRGKVWPIEGVYSFMHIDSTIALLREGLMLLNPERIKTVAQLPPPLRNWDVIWAPEPEPMAVWPGYVGASKWLNVNLLSVSPDLVIIEENQHSLRKALESHKIECAMLPGRHQRTLSGGFHCVTLDIHRD